jgi:hypothetical protein
LTEKTERVGEGENITDRGRTVLLDEREEERDDEGRIEGYRNWKGPGQ